MFLLMFLPLGQPCALISRPQQNPWEKQEASESVIEPKSACLTQSESKQTATSEFGAEKGLLQGTNQGG